MINDQSPYFPLCGCVGLLHEILMLCGSDGATLQHIPDLLANSAIVLSRQSVPKLLLCGFQSAFHVVFKPAQSPPPRPRFIKQDL